ncbi:tripartite tricarboxylate transporter TctB family protein [Paenisporosarcina sp. TG-14]|uniref:tripartite tricarboxylate transporter TctB family protein n=1 Tax=Paenisporosarcina sp. TG-14 TaxID=1231057 RepID=UPI0002E8FC65|nr:tripartite tricarboxylate transporter TctB family protein [Paenisporosarcina sp. TG-14]
MKSERVKDITVALIVLAISAIFYSRTAILTSPSDIFPKFVIIIFGILGTLLLLKSIFSKKYKVKDDDEKDITDLKRRWISILSLVAYIIIMPIVGFYVTSGIFVTLLSLYIQNEKLGFMGSIKPLVISGLTMVFLYLTFSVFLKVPIPSGLLI